VAGISGILFTTSPVVDVEQWDSLLSAVEKM
jgi:hypothetical protein